MKLLYAAAILAFLSARADDSSAAPELAPDMKLATTLSGATAYVGQPVTLEVAWTFAGNIGEIHAVDIRLPLLESDRFQNRDFYSLPAASGKPIGLPVNGTRVIGRASRRTIRFRKIIVPRQPGSYLLPAATLVCSVVRVPPGEARRALDSQDGFQYPAYFDNQFFADADDPRTRRVYVRAPPLALKVMALPVAGRPANFFGIVGSFVLSDSIAPASAREGEPVTLTVRAAGSAYPEALELPPLDAFPGFPERFRIVADRSDAVIEPGPAGLEKIFRQSFRPRSSGESAVPAIAVSYFDPASGVYRVARASEIPLHVLPGAVADGAGAVLSDGRLLKSRLVPEARGIGPNFSDQELLQPEIAAWTQTSAYGWETLGLPPGLCALYLWLTRRQRYRRRHPREERILWAFADFEAELRKADDAVAVTDAINRYLGRRLDLGMVSFGRLEAGLKVRGVARPDLDALGEIYAARDRRDYAALALPGEGRFPTKRAARTLVRSVETVLRGPRKFSAVPCFWFPAFAGLLCAVSLVGAAPEPAPVLAAGGTFFRAGLDLLHEDDASSNDAFRKSAAEYEYLIRTADPALNRAGLHYNAGAAAFFAGDLGLAIFHFRLALQALPGNGRVRDALGYARKLQPDLARGASLKEAADFVFLGRNSIGLEARKLLLSACATLFWIFLAAAAHRNSRGLRRASVLLLLVSAWFGASLAADALERRCRDEGVVLEPEAIARQGPAEVYEPAFHSPIHAGAEFHLLGRSGDWLQIRIPGAGPPAWIQSRAARMLDQTPGQYPLDRTAR